MDVLTELLPPSHLIKSENSSKDNNKKNKQYRKVQQSNVSDNNGKKIARSSLRESSTWDKVERRSGKDRREQVKCRGRWLESRSAKDCRQIAQSIQICI